MKVFRLLFSRWALAAILLLIQIGLVITLLLLFSEYFVAFRAFGTVVSVIVFFIVVNKKETPEYKIPWIFLILFAPLFGVVFYLLFANHNLSKKRNGKIIDLNNELLKYADNNKKEKQRVNEYLGQHTDIETMLNNISGVNGYLNNDVKYYKVGEEMFLDMLVELEKAKKFILIEYFIIRHGEMWDSIHKILRKKADQGVDIKLIYDDVGSMGYLSYYYYRKLRSEGIQAYKFHAVKPIVSNIYNNRDHRKIMVIDGKVGFTGGINLGDEYINKEHPFGHWKDTGIRVKGSAVNGLTHLFFLNYDVTSKEKSDYAKYFNKHPIRYNNNGYLIPFGDGPKPFYSKQVGESNFINIISQAKKYVYITTPYLIINHRMASALRDAAFRGVDVRIITPHIPDKKVVFIVTQSNYPYLLEAGVKIYEYKPGFIHAKMLVCDDEISFIGTINLDYRSLTHHYENGVTMYKQDCFIDMYNDFNNIFACSIEINKDFKLSPMKSLISYIVGLFQPML